jgi:hypothetical protein
MKYSSGLATLTMADVQVLDRARQSLRMIYDAIGATNVQGKPAMLGILDQADDCMQSVMRKGARRAVKLGLAGAYQRKHLSTDFVQRLAELAGVSPTDDEGAADSSSRIPDAINGEGREAPVSGASELEESLQK